MAICSTLTRPEGGACSSASSTEISTASRPLSGTSGRTFAIARSPPVSRCSARRTVAQRAGLALDQRDVMLPVVSHQTFVGQPFEFLRHGVLAHHKDAARM